MLGHNLNHSDPRPPRGQSGEVGGSITVSTGDITTTCLWIGSGTQRSPNGTEAYSDGNHTSHTLLGDVNGGAATVGTMSLPLTPLVTDIQWPRWLKIV